MAVVIAEPGPDAEERLPAPAPGRALALPAVALSAVLVLAVGVLAVVHQRTEQGPQRLGEPAWTARLDGPPATGLFGVATVDDALLFTAADSLHRVDPETGDLGWRVHVAHLSGVLAGAGRWVVAPTLDGLTAVDARTGEIEWHAEVGGVVGQVEVAGGAVAVSAWSDAGPPRLSVLDLTTGELRWGPWEFTSLSGGPAVAVGSTIFTETHGGGLQAIDLDTGRERWTRSTAGYPVAATGELVITVRPTRPAGGSRPDQELVAVHNVDGEEVWVAPLRQAGPITAVAGWIYVPEPGRIVALDADDGAERWSVETAISVADLTVAEDLVIAGGPHGVVALDATSGRVRWESPGPTEWGLTSVGGAVVLVNDSGLTGLDVATGRERFHVRQGVPVACPVAVDGLIVTPTTGGVRAVSAQEGKIRWRNDLLEPRDGPGAGLLYPSLGMTGQGEVVAGTAGWVGHGGPDLPLAVIDAATGELRWQRDLDGPLLGQPAFGDGTVYVQSQRIANASATLLALDLADGSERWDVPTSISWAYQSGSGWFGPTGPQAVRGHVLSVAGGDAVVAHDVTSGDLAWRYQLPMGPSPRALRIAADGTTAHAVVGDELHAIDVETGQQRWRLSFDHRLRGVPATSEGALVVGVGERLVALDAATGAIRWEATVDGGVGAGATVHGGRVYVATGRGLAIHDLSSGRELATRDTERAVLAPPIVVEGRLVACLGDGSLATW